MNTFSAAVVALMASSAMAFAPATSSERSTALKAGMPDRMWDKMVDKTQRSKSLPWLPRPVNLDGSMAGDVGFDPFYLSSIDKNFAGFIQPPSWEPTKGISTVYWMREAELKHCRIAMLAVLGWLATDGAITGFPLRWPGPYYGVDQIPDAYHAHDVLVEQGSMTVMLIACGLIEICNSAALVQVSKGELDREPGNFTFDPLNFYNGKSKEQQKKLEENEVQNGRLAMLAFGGIATQTALGHFAPPYF